MIWAKAALAGGLLVLLAAFATGTENQLSASVMGQAQDCGPSISASWLVSGTPDQAQPGSAATDDERRTAASCGPAIHESRVLIVTIMGMGCLLALIGWTAIGTRRETVPHTVTPARA
ncbi:hypothetical protein [Nocardioides sp.]|uniref:hypothetical protein n=1 Tax=Nocardioides sp. TaxID=35761 RepID=UPI00286E7A70|nr:hypothetical protein [Nocardioides sp.]